MSEIITDKLTGKTSAGDVTITSEGGAATMQLQQGVAKCWVNFDGTGTIAARDSFNLSSLTDSGTGSYRVNFSSSLANANYVGGGTFNWGNNGNQINCTPNSTTQAYALILEANAYVDRTPVNVSYLGDLA